MNNKYDYRAEDLPETDQDSMPEQIEASEEIKAASMAAPAVMAAAADETFEDAKDYLEAPFSYSMDSNESVALNSGTLQHTVTDFVLPGKNGFDLAIRRRYDSYNCNMQDMTPDFSEEKLYLHRVFCDEMFVRYKTNNYSLYNMAFYLDFTPRLEGEAESKGNERAEDLASWYESGIEQIEIAFYSKSIQSSLDRFRKVSEDVTHAGTKYYRYVIPNTSSTKITGVGSFYVKTENVSVKDVLHTGTRANSHYIRQHGLGYGWNFDLPSIESVREDSQKNKVVYHTFLHLEDGRSFKLKGTALEDHAQKDVEYSQSGGTLTHPVVKAQTRPYSCTVKYKTGCTDYFQQVKGTDNKVDCYKLVGRTDRFGNMILFSMADYGGMTIIDTWGREIKLVKSGTNLTWTLPDTNKIKYTTQSLGTNQFLLQSVTDQAGRVTTYEYESKNAGAKYRDYVYGDSELATINYRHLTSVTHPGGGKTVYTYGMSDNKAITFGFDKYGGFRQYFPLRSRKDVYGSTAHNEYTYAYQAASPPSNMDYGKYIQTATVTKKVGDGTVLETHTFNDQNRRTKKVVTHTGKKVSESNYTYGTETNNKKLLTKEVVVQYNPNNNSNSITKTIEYSYDNNKANVSKITEKYSENSANNQETTFEYDSNYSIVTKKTWKKSGSITMTEVNTLDGKLIKSSAIQEGSTEKEKTTFEYSNNNITKETRTGNGSTFVTTYTWGSYAAAPITKQVSGVKDVNNALIASGYGAGVIRESFEYDVCGRLKTYTDPNKNATSYTRDKLGRVTSEALPGNVSRTTTYNDSSNQITVKDENGNQTRYDYTAFGKIKTESILVGSSWTKLREYSYDNHERLTKESISQGTTTAYTWDLFDRVLSKTVTGTGISSRKETYAYADLHDSKTFRTTRTTTGDASADSIVTITDTDRFGRVVREQTGDTVNTCTYDIVGNRLSMTDAFSKVTKWEYDHAGRVTKETNPLSQTVQTKYNVLGSKTEVTDRDRTSYFTYDAAGRLIRQRIPFVSDIPAETRFLYDAAGNLTRQLVQCHQPGQTAAWRVTGYVYDVRNRQTDVYLYKNAALTQYSRTQYVYDNVGNKKEVRTGLTHNAADAAVVTKYTWDRFGNMLTMTDPQGRTESFSYNLGVPQSKTDRNKNKITFTTDAMRRITKEEVSATYHPDRKVSSVRTYSYAATGAKTSETGTETLTGEDAVATKLQYKYDSRGLLKEQTDEGGITKTYTWDKNGNRKTFVLKRDGTIEISLQYDYDELNRLKEVRNNRANAVIAVYTYDKYGNRQKLQYPQTGVEVSYTYNHANLVTKMESRQNSVLKTVWSYSYALDGNQVSKTDRYNKTTRYTYDTAGRLVSEAVPDDKTYRYEYDRFENRSKKTVINTRTGKQESVTTYSYNTNNWMILEEIRSDSKTERFHYRYDANGNQCAREYERTLPNPSGINPGRIGFASAKFQDSTTLLDTRDYNGFNQTVRVLRDGVETRYRYRPDGLRHSKSTGSAAGAARTVTTHVWDGSNIVMERNTGNAVIARYLRGIDLIARHTSGMQYYLHNAHGDVTHCGDTEYVYDAFGNQKNPVHTDENPFRYCGEYFDKETDEIYLRARSYDTRTGRFTSEDVAHDGMNWYTYCGNNPIKHVDPSGHYSENPFANLYPGTTGLYEDYLSSMTATERTEFFIDLANKSEDPAMKYLCMLLMAFNAPGRIFEVISKTFEVTMMNMGFNMVEGTESMDPQLAKAAGDVMAGYLISTVVADAIAGISKIGKPRLLGRGNTGRTEPNNLLEQISMEQVMSDPLAYGEHLKAIQMGDPRWAGDRGWIKMQAIIEHSDKTNTTIHFNYNPYYNYVDDFKFIGKP